MLCLDIKMPLYLVYTVDWAYGDNVTDQYCTPGASERFRKWGRGGTNLHEPYTI